jgi:hypothetical protein
MKINTRLRTEISFIISSPRSLSLEVYDAIQYEADGKRLYAVSTNPKYNSSYFKNHDSVSYHFSLHNIVTKLEFLGAAM